MPGWGTGSFDNDDAKNFLGVLHSKEPADLELVLAQVADHEGYLEAPESSVAVAAAEVVATGRGKPPATVPHEIAEWVNKVEGEPSTKLSELARRAVDRVRTNSELKDLWLEAEGLNDWSAALRDLEERLSGEGPE
ncbi:MAG: DUF4259 domain-containing protein [Terriglobales bacterium]